MQLNEIEMPGHPVLGRKEGSLSRRRRLEALSNTTGGSCTLEVPWCLGWPTCPWTWRVPARPPVDGVGEMSEYPTRRMVHSQPAGGGGGVHPRRPELPQRRRPPLWQAALPGAWVLSFQIWFPELRPPSPRLRPDWPRPELDILHPSLA